MQKPVAIQLNLAIGLRNKKALLFQSGPNCCANERLCNALIGHEISLSVLFREDSVMTPNSGGPLIDAAGHVVGMPRAIISPGIQMGLGQSSGIGLAVSAAELKKATDDLIRYGEVRAGLPRFSVKDAVGRGAEITSVETGSGAEKIGLEAGDVIVGFDERKIGSANDFNVAVYFTSPGERHLLTVEREGKKSGFDLTMGGDVAPVHPLPPRPKTLAAATAQK